MPMAGLDAAVLVRHPKIIARRIQAIMGAKASVASCGIVVFGQVPISSRQAIGAMRLRHGAELPERLLQPLGQCRETLTTLDHLHILPTGECQPEMVKQMRE